MFKKNKNNLSKLKILYLLCICIFNVDINNCTRQKDAIPTFAITINLMGDVAKTC